MAVSALLSRARALIAFTATLALGAAFLHQGQAQREAERRLAATQAGGRVAAALERDTASAFTALREVGVKVARGTSLAQAEAGHPLIEALVHVGNGRVRERHPLGDGGFELEALMAPARGGQDIVGPFRGAGGALKVALRVPHANDAAGSGHLGAVVHLDSLVHAAQLAQLARDGFDHRLVAVGPRTPTLSRSRDAALDAPVVRSMRLGGTEWFLEIAPRGGWRDWSSLSLHALVVVLLALAAALSAHEGAKDRRLMRAAIGERDARLREATQRMLDEARQREDLEKQFSHASFHDALTGLPNRRFLVSRLEASLRRALTAPEELPAIAVLELGRLKPISDSLGIAVADELLGQAARRFEAALGAGRVACRAADSAFAAVLTGPRELVLESVASLQHALSQSFDVSGHTLFVAARAGVAFAGSGYDHPEDLLRSAHVALSRAKREQARVMVFDASTQEQVISRQQLEAGLHGVVERGELRLHYQPIVELANGRLAGFEALVRWQHPREGMISPGLFIPLAEETGLIEPITRWVMAQACGQVRAWNATLPRERQLYVSVNLSAHDMRLADMGDFVEGIIAEAGIAASMLRLEVTESSMIDNLRAAVDLIKRFRAMGVKVLLDDFGTGYSSLSYLNQFEIDYLKIDQSFVRQITPDPRSSGIVRAILSMCEGMDIRTVAEGIENAQAMQLLQGLRCDYGQGYHFSRPVAAEAATRLLAEWTASTAQPHAVAAD